MFSDVTEERANFTFRVQCGGSGTDIGIKTADIWALRKQMGMRGPLRWPFLHYVPHFEKTNGGL
jgi:hypothetical protein